MSKKKFILLLPLVALAITACNNDDHSSSDYSSATSESLTTSQTTSTTTSTTTSDSGTTSEINPQELWDAALNQDYTNSTTYAMASTSEGDGYPAYIYNYNGYNIVHDHLYNYMYGETIYNYYHDYEGISHLYFEDEGNGDAWLSLGYHDAPLGIENNYFDIMYFQEVLKELDYNSVEPAYVGGYYITDTAVMEELNYSIFMFEDRYIEYCFISIDENTQLFDSVVGFVNYDDDQNYVEASFMDIGTTTFTDTTLPPAPNEDNVRTYADYKGEDPWVETHVTSLTLSTFEENASLTIDLDETLLLKVDFAPVDANMMLLTPHSDDEDVVLIDYASETRTYEVYGLHEGTTTVYIEDEVTGIISNKLTIIVNGVALPSREDVVNDITFDYISSTDGSIVYTDNIVGASPVEFTLDEGGNTDIRAHTNNSSLQLVRPEETAILYFEPGQGGANNPQAHLDIDTLTNSVDGLSFYYGLEFESHYANINYVSAKIYTSIDGNEYTLVEDFTNEYLENVSPYNMSLYELNFDSLTRYIRIEFDVNFIGKNVWTVIQGLRLYKTPSTDIVMESVSFNDFNQTIYVDDVFTTPITISPADTTDKGVTFSSSDVEVIEVVDASVGQFRALKAGTSTLTVRANQNSAIMDTLLITVNEKVIDVTSIEITSEDTMIECDQTVALTVNVEARQPNLTGYTLSLNDNTLGSIVYDDYNNPSFEARKPGTVVISATSSVDTTKTDSVTIEITPVMVDNNSYDSAVFDLESPDDYSTDWNYEEVTVASARLVKASDDTLKLFVSVNNEPEVSFYAYSYYFGEPVYFRSYDEDLALDVSVEASNGSISIQSIDYSWGLYLIDSVPAEGAEIIGLKEEYTVGETIELSVALLPDYTTDDVISVQWTIEDTNVVTTEDSLDGETLTLAANEAGSCTVSVLVNNEFNATITINVIDKVEEVKIPSEYYGDYADADYMIMLTVDADGIYVIDYNLNIYIQFSVIEYDATTNTATLDEHDENYTLEVVFYDVDGTLTLDVTIYTWSGSVEAEYFGCTQY